MNIQSKLIAAVALAVSASPIASAQEVTLTIDPADPVAKIHADIKTAALGACRAAYRDSAFRKMLPGAANRCTRELMDKLVDDLGMQDVAAYHQAPKAERLLLASKD